MKVSGSLIAELEKEVDTFKGGCIKSRIDEWRKLTSDAEILNIVQGLSIGLMDDLPE